MIRFVVLTLLVIFSGYNDDDFAPRLGFCKMTNHLFQAAPHVLFVYLRYFPSHAHLPVRAEMLRKLLQGLEQPVGRFVEYHGALLFRQLQKKGLAAFLLGKKPLETEAVAGQSGRHDGRNAGGGAGQSDDRNACSRSLPAQIEAGIADTWSSRIADERHRLRRFLMSKCFSRMPEVRVSSANTKSASLRMRMARIVISSIFPTGVGIIYKVPICEQR